MKIKQCPCGSYPKYLSLRYNGQGGTWAEGMCDQCGEWSIEFRTRYHGLDSDEAQELAIEAWNSAPRGWEITNDE